MCVVRGVEVRGRSEVCGRGGVDVGSGSMSVLLYCIGVCTCALCVCVLCVCVCVCVCTTVKMAIHLQCLACATLQGMYSLGGFLVSMCAAVLLSLQMVQSGRGLEVLWCLLREDFLYFWSYPEEVEQSRLVLHVMSSMTASLPSLLPPEHVHVIVVCCVYYVCVCCVLCVCVVCVCVFCVLCVYLCVCCMG